jgi:4-hydroxyphenylpyruvate dioxygenase
MGIYESYKFKEFDHLEYAVGDLDKTTAVFLNLGFEKVASREIRERQLQSFLLQQGGINIVLSKSTLATDPVASYVATHGDGICSVGLRVEDAVSALELAVGRGAEVAESPMSFQKDYGTLDKTAIKVFGDVRYTFVSREGNLFLEGFETPVKPQGKGYGLQRIDHVTNNVENGKRQYWADWFKKVFGFIDTRYFDIKGARTGLYSTVMQSPDGLIKMPFNEPTEGASQIQEFLDIHHGPGIQHVALSTETILESVAGLRKAGFRFLEVPQTYYEAVPKRVPYMKEELAEVAALNVLVDGNKEGYLLQIFTQTLIGPFFFEVIQRRGNDGFGEGNFTALFEAMEADQIRRGVLKA